MKKILIRAVLLVGMPTLTWFGFVDGVDGALYTVKFFVWAICLPAGLLALSELAQKGMAKEPPSGAAYLFTSRAVAWGSLGMMVWTGHIATATAWGLYMLCGAIAAEGAKRHRAASAATSAA